MTYFLIHKHPKEYVAYLRLLSAKKPLVQDSPEERLDEFRRIFGDLAKLNAEFVRYMVRARSAPCQNCLASGQAARWDGVALPSPPAKSGAAVQLPPQRLAE